MQVAEQLVERRGPPVMQIANAVVDAQQRRRVEALVGVVFRVQSDVVNLPVGEVSAGVTVRATRRGAGKHLLAATRFLRQAAVALPGARWGRLRMVSRNAPKASTSSSVAGGPCIVSARLLATAARKSFCQPCQNQGPVCRALRRLSTVLYVPNEPSFLVSMVTAFVPPS